MASLEAELTAIMTVNAATREEAATNLATAILAADEFSDIGSVSLPTEYAVPFSAFVIQPATTSTSFQDVTTPASSVTTYCLCFFDPSKFPATIGALSREIYIEYVGMSNGANAVQFQLSNASDGEVVGSSASDNMSGTSPTQSIKGPLTVGATSGNIKNTLKQYRIQGRQVGSAANARIIGARFLIRYV